MDTTPLISLQNISAGYGQDLVLKNVSMDIYPNDFIGVIGPNGGGKTTLLKVILELIKPHSGTIKFNTSRKGAIGYLPQINTIDNKFPITSKEVILSGKVNRKNYFRRNSKADQQEATYLLEKMGAGHLINKSIGELSGGQMQRVFLCRALISKPEVLILDEPNTFVDNNFEGELYKMLREYNKTMSIVMVSHDLGTISSYVKTIACVNKSLHYHHSNIITEKQLASYNCPLQLITHGDVPHTVLKQHPNE